MPFFATAFCLLCVTLLLRCSEKKTPNFTWEIKIHVMQITDLSNKTQIPLVHQGANFKKFGFHMMTTLDIK